MAALNSPLISCVCVTNNRPGLLRFAVANFLRQTYPNTELVIVHKDDDKATREYLKYQGFQDRLRVIEVPAASDPSLGDLRNISIQASRGEYIIQWDDDDWCHPRRIELQMQALLEFQKPAVLLSQILMFDTPQQKLTLSIRRPWEGTILCKKEYMPVYPSLARSEDSHVTHELLRQNQIGYLNSANLYTYIYHSRNTWEYEHWSLFLAPKESIPEIVLAEMRTELSYLISGQSNS